MAELLTIQDSIDGRLDTQTLKEAINEDKVIVSRLGKEYPSVPMASRLLVENGLLGATPFSTYALMTASSLANNAYAVVTNDPTASKNGAYQKISGSWVYLAYNPMAQINDLQTKVTTKNLTVNMFDKSVALIDKRLSSTDGTVYTQAAYATSDYIKVQSGSVYKKSYAGRHSFYDVNKIFISYGDAQTEITAPTGAVYARFSLATNTLDVAMFTLKADYPAAYVPYKSAVYVGELAANKELLAEDINGYITVDKTQAKFIVRTSLQLFDKSKTTQGYRVSQQSGLLLVYAGTQVSDYIAVKPSTTYVQSEGNYFAEYDANKNFVKGYTTGTTQFTTASTTAYVRVTVRDVVINTYILAEGAVLPPYQAYDIYTLDRSIKTSAEVTASKWEGKNWNVLGDSITADADSYWRTIAEQKVFATARNYGIGGTSIARRTAPEGVSNPDLYTQDWIANRYKNMDNNADLITIAGGTNDFKQVPLGTFDVRDDSTVYGATRDLIEGVVDKYPIAKIGFILPFHRYDSLATKNPYTFMTLRDALIECCNFYGIPYFDSVNMLPVRFYNAANANAWSRVSGSTGLPDGLHPNTECHQVIADIVGRWIESI